MGDMNPTAVANEALDSIGSPLSLGDIEDGSDEAAIVLRHYRQCLQQMLRAAHWQFARKQAPLLMLADASGQTPNVGSVVPQGWQYEYAYPTDCMKVRFVPWNPLNSGVPVPAGNIQIPTNVPLTGGADTLPFQTMRQRPTRFLIATDYNYPPQSGQMTWDVQGESPQGRTVVLTNVNQASIVYTALMLYPSVWDPLFRSAMVAYLACEVALPLWVRKGDPKFGLQMKEAQMKVTKDKVTEARLVDGNETTSSADMVVDWMTTRRDSGLWAGPAWNGMPGGGDGYYGQGWDTLPINGATAF